MKIVQSGVAADPKKIAGSLKRRMSESQITGTLLQGGQELIEILEGAAIGTKVYELALSGGSAGKRSLLAIGDADLNLLGCMLIKAR
ncbi:MAG: hypothetical protein ABI882_12840 [Acidobacteriota bacterium]